MQTDLPCLTITGSVNKPAIGCTHSLQNILIQGQAVATTFLAYLHAKTNSSYTCESRQQDALAEKCVFILWRWT